MGEGRVVLDESGLRYDGTQEGREVSKLFSAQATFALPCTLGDNFEIPNPTEHLSIHFADNRKIPKYVIAMRVAHEAADASPT